MPLNVPPASAVRSARRDESGPYARPQRCAISRISIAAHCAELDAARCQRAVIDA
jgi:hypothetical protein